MFLIKLVPTKTEIPKIHKDGRLPVGSLETLLNIFMLAQKRKKDVPIFDGFGIKPHSIFILLSLKVLISFFLHLFTFLHEGHDKPSIYFYRSKTNTFYFRSEPKKT